MDRIHDSFSNTSPFLTLLKLSEGDFLDISNGIIYEKN